MKNFVSALLLFLHAIAWTEPAHAQQGNADVLELLQAKIGEDVILQVVDAAEPSSFDTSAASLVKLKTAGASDALMARILARKSGAAQPTPSAAASGACVDNGVTLQADGKTTILNYQNSTPMSKMSAGNFFASALTLGIVSSKVETLYSIRGSRAAVRIQSRTPEFIDVFFLSGQAPESTVFLARLVSREKEKDRVIVAGKAGMGLVSGMKVQTGVEDKNMVALTFEKSPDACVINGARVDKY
ncbi:MAG: hypothetical protein JNK21_01495, partial [Rhodospirillaceae bacterium]|nr:hypothetical protein [Rhodospirillaceae bacterium]